MSLFKSCLTWSGFPAAFWKIIYVAVIGVAWGMLLSACSARKVLQDKCGGQICSLRVNVKDGGKASKWDNFGTSGSGTVRGNQPWPKYTVYAKVNGQKTAIFNNSGTSVGSNGEMGWQRMNRCLNFDELMAIQGEGLDPGSGRDSDSQLTFYVSNHPTACPGLCIVYRMVFSKTTVRFTFDEGKCGVNVDVQALPIKNRNGTLRCVTCP